MKIKLIQTYKYIVSETFVICMRKPRNASAARPEADYGADYKISKRNLFQHTFCAIRTGRTHRTPTERTDGGLKT